MTDNRSHQPASNWEEMLRTQLHDHEAEPPADLWESIECDLAAAQPKEGRVVPLATKWASAAAVAAIVVGVGISTLYVAEAPKTMAEAPKPTAEASQSAGNTQQPDAQTQPSDARPSQHAVSLAPKAPPASAAADPLPRQALQKVATGDSEDGFPDPSDTPLAPDATEALIASALPDASEAPIIACEQQAEDSCQAAPHDDEHYYVSVTAQPLRHKASTHSSRRRVSFAFHVGQGSALDVFSSSGDGDCLAAVPCPDNGPHDDSQPGNQTGGMGIGGDGSSEGFHGSYDDAPDDNDSPASASCHRAPRQTPLQKQDDPYILTYSDHDFPIKTAALFRVRFTDRIALDAGLSYTFLRSSICCRRPDITPFWQGEQRVHYLGIPVALSCNLYGSRRWSVYISAGGEVAKAVGVDWRRDDHLLASAPEHPWQLNVTAAAGVQYNLSRHMGIYLQPSADYYFDNHSRVRTYYSEHPFTPSLQMGLRFNVK